ncbi:hypothetical protein FHL15_010305 [Xylaria flabelliformis]|uniref:Ecp2 effector protein domain-containing protein n=1 Tax=Xylaria flabelliformis TaxID=2512241 RepID=A0A553HLQ8_9PEZI|nr:hypothetical protein FHL15_010305 [Xylaria flabelliformis]
MKSLTKLVMHLSFPLLALSNTAGATGFRVPEGQPDGVYRVNYDSAGSAVHTWLRAPVGTTDQVPTSGTTRSMHVRDYDYIDCGGYGLNSGDTDRAVASLKAQCNPGAVNSGYDFYSISGSTVAYICDLGGSAIVCQQSELANSYAKITGTCGRYGSGWETVDTAAYKYQIGYEDRFSEADYTM